MRSPQTVLETLRKHAQKAHYQYERLYRNLYNPQLYLLAYQNLYANKGSTTAGADGATLSGMSLKRIESLIKKLRDRSYQPHPARRQYIPKKSGNGLRPLGIPAADDKLVQEAVRMILESIYEPTFQSTSHGFRPGKSCHTALSQIQKTFTGVSWFVEGDIKGCFDNIDHHILVNILKRRIKDEAFIDLIWKLLRAGYLEDWMKHQTYSGTPQGSGVSPLLANIYMNELDLFMEKLRAQFGKGDKRRFSNDYVNANHHYARTRERNAKKWNTMSEEERKDAKVMQKKLQAILLSTPSREPMDPNYRRVLYVRYADDFLIGVIGNKADAEQIKTAVSEFLKQELNLTMSPEKTLITHGHDKARFLGYDITISKNQAVKKTKGGVKRAYNGRVVLLLPKEKWMGKLQEYRALNIQKDGTGKEIWMPVARNGLQNKEPIEILAQFNGEIRGIYNYYRLARNVSVLNKFCYVMEYADRLHYKYKVRAVVEPGAGRDLRPGDIRPGPGRAGTVNTCPAKGSDNARVWDTSKRAIQIVLNNLKGIFFRDDDLEQMTFSGTGRRGGNRYHDPPHLSFSRSRRLRLGTSLSASDFAIHKDSVIDFYMLPCYNNIILAGPWDMGPWGHQERSLRS